MTNFYALNQWIQNESNSVTRTVFNSFQSADKDYQALNLKVSIKVLEKLRTENRPDLTIDQFLSECSIEDILTLITIKLKKNRKGLNGFFLRWFMPLLISYHSSKLGISRQHMALAYSKSFQGDKEWWHYNHGTFLGGLMLYLTDRDYNVFREKQDSV